MPHPFVLVLHFPPESPLNSADIEDEIAEAIGNPRDDENAEHIVDGNEIGDAIDIFVMTRNPVAALELCKPLLQQAGLLDVDYGLKLYRFRGGGWTSRQNCKST